MAVLHFPCTAPHAGGYVDFNTTHMGEEAIDDKYVGGDAGTGWALPTTTHGQPPAATTPFTAGSRFR